MPMNDERQSNRESDDANVSLEKAVKNEPNWLKKILLILGPGLVTGASDDDPSGIATYASAGAKYGYATLWTALLTFPMMAAVQYICAKIALVSGEDIATILRKRFPKPVLWAVVVLLSIANTINLGVDIGAVAAGLNLLFGGSIALICIPVGVLLVIMQIFCSYRTIASIFKWLTLSLFAYIGSSIFAKPEWRQVMINSFIPQLHWDGEFLSMLVAILGTSISPYLFFWQATQEIEEQKGQGRIHLWQRKGATDSELSYAAIDVNVGMLLSNVVMYFIILSSAATLHQAGKTKIETAAEAALALKPLAGAAAEWLMALGLIGSGILAIPVLAASSSYALCEALKIRAGLDHKPRRARAFYTIISICTVVGMTINFLGINPITALIWTAVINGFLAPPLLGLIMLISSDREIMGDRTNSAWLKAIGWFTVIVMSAAAIGLIATWGK